MTLAEKLAEYRARIIGKGFICRDESLAILDLIPLYDAALVALKIYRGATGQLANHNSIRTRDKVNEARLAFEVAQSALASAKERLP